MHKREELEKAISQLEDQRDTLGNEAVDAALAGLSQRLVELEEPEAEPNTEATEVKTSYKNSERRVVTVLFCDVASSTALAESMDPEAWTGIMKTTFEYLIEPVERFGGTVARLMGDAILAFFGAPTAHEDDPQRAVLAGLAIVEKIAPYREKLRAEKGIDFNVRVGINTGLAVVGEIGSKSAGEYTAMGDAVNLAARMEQTAAPGTVQIAQDTYALVAPLFEVEELGGIPVKGKSEPVPAYRVLEQKTRPGSLRGLTDQGLNSPLVGRESEFKSAQNTVERLLAGQGGVLFIQGEAGVGKSRLVAELHGNLENENSQIIWLEGHNLSYGQTISYLPFQQILRTYAGITEEDNDTEAWRKLETRLDTLFTEEMTDVLPYLASLLAIEPRGDYIERIKYLDSEALGHQIFRASRLFFQRLAELRPLVLVIEDLHWMDRSSAGLLEHLLPLIQNVPILICGLSRPDPNTPGTYLPEIAASTYVDRYTEIVLTPLSGIESDRLVKNLLEIDDIPETIQKMMVSKADGNPFFLEEIVRDLIQAGALAHEPKTGRWRATREIEKVTLPDTIQGLINARIDRLDDSLKQVVRRAAVIGRQFLYRILNTVIDDGRDLDAQLNKLQSVDLIKENQHIPELEYIFKHALAQEAVYEGILLQERREVHARVGAAIESQMADRIDEFYGLLAYHYSAAEQWEQAQDYLFKAGDQAGRMAADAEALALYHQAMEAYARVRGDDWEPFERAQLERKIGEALYRLGEHEQAITYLERSLVLLGNNLPTSKWGTRLAIFRALITQFGHRLFPSWFVGSMGESTNPVIEELFQVSLAINWIEIFRNAERYFLVSINALNASERAGYAYGSSYLASTLATGFLLMGRRGLTERYFKLATQYAQKIKPSRPVFYLELGQSFHYNLFVGDLEKSIQHARRGAEIAMSTGDIRGWGSAMDIVGWGQYLQGKLAEHIETREQMIAVAEEGSDSQVLCWGLMGLGATQIYTGQIEEAIATLKHAQQVAEEVGDLHTQLGSQAIRSRAYIVNGEVDQTLSILDEIQEKAKARGVVFETTELGILIAEAYLAAAEQTQGKTRHEWLKKAGISCRKTLKSIRNNRPIHPEAMWLMGRYEWLDGKPDEAKKWWDKALAEAQYMGERYFEGIIHLEIGDRLGDREHLLRAASIFEEIGAELNLVKTREALANLDAG